MDVVFERHATLLSLRSDTSGTLCRYGENIKFTNIYEGQKTMKSLRKYEVSCVEIACVTNWRQQASHNLQGKKSQRMSRKYLSWTSCICITIWWEIFELIIIWLGLFTRPLWLSGLFLYEVWSSPYRSCVMCAGSCRFIFDWPGLRSQCRLVC